MTDTSTPHSPREVVARLVRRIGTGRWDRLHELFADDAVLHHPFARDASRVIEGQEALRRHFAHMARSGLRLQPRDVSYHDGADPEVVVGELVYDGTGPQPDERFELAACLLWRVREGRIVESHDYLDRPRPVPDAPSRRS